MRRLAEIQARGAERAEVTLASLLAELEEARQLALRERQSSAAVQASMGKARLTAHVVDRREVGSPGEFAELTDAELIAKARREARGLAWLTRRSIEMKSTPQRQEARWLVFSKRMALGTRAPSNRIHGPR